MTFESFMQAQSFFLWATFVIALVMGALVNKTNFCTMGAVSDWVNMGDTGRFRAWMLAIAIAILGVVILEFFNLASPGSSFPPYRGSQIIVAENILGGLMFGIGMTLASGCGNKNLVRFGAGNIKSLMVLVIIGLIAYFMLNPFPGSDQTLFSVLFIDWIRPMSISATTPQDLGSLLTAEKAGTARLVIGILLALGLIVYAFKSSDLRGSLDNILGGVIVGLAVVAAWYVTSNVMIDVDGETNTLQGYVQNWDFIVDRDAMEPEAAAALVKPAETRSLAAQSFTFINPLGQTGGWLASGLSRASLTFGTMAVFGVILGSLLWSLISRSFRIEWFASLQDFVNHFIGAILMGFGGTLAMGCTIGQAVTGISTLAVGSFLTFFAIVLGCALTLKVQFYRMVYEDASFMAVLLTSLVDLKLLPSALRKLDAI